jgi:hypothetical protein
MRHEFSRIADTRLFVRGLGEAQRAWELTRLPRLVG